MATGLAIKQPFDRSDFLVWEAAQPDRWELVGGIIRLVAGGRVDHNLVAGNVFAFTRGCVAAPASRSSRT